MKLTQLTPWYRAIAWLQAFYRFSRPHTIAGTSISVAALYLLAWDYNARAHTNIPGLMLALLSCLAANIYIVGLNQITDVEIDRINKPDLPLACGAFSMRTGRWLVTLCLFAALAIALTQGVFLFVTVALSIAIGTAYSLPPIRLKRYYFWAAASIFTVRGAIVNLFLFLHFSAIVDGPLTVPAYVWLLTGFMFGLSLVIAWFKDIPDEEGDRHFHIASLSLRLGADRVFRLGLWLLTSCYAAMLAAGLLGMSGLNGPAMVVSHTLLLAVLWWRSRRVATPRGQDIRAFYLFVWALFYVEYVTFTLAALLA